MKRNHFVGLSKSSTAFSMTSGEGKKSRHLLSLSIFTVVSVCITSIVLATSQPTTELTHSQVIDLPNLPAEMQNLTSINTPIAQDTHQVRLETSSDVKTHSSEETIPNKLTVTDLALLEQQAIDASHMPSETTLANTTTLSAELPTVNWHKETVKSGDNLSLIFNRVGLTARDVHAISRLGKDIKPLLNLKPGQQIAFGLSSDTEFPIARLELAISPTTTFVVEKGADSYQTSTEVRDVEKRQVYTSGTISSSLFGAGKEAGMSDKLVMELAYVFGWDIDFALDLRENDHFKVIYTEDYLDGEKIADGEIIAAEFVNQGKSFKAISYTDENGLTRFYTPNGDSMRKTFNRTPVHFSRISSRFNPNRKHPKLVGVTRPHRGVDYAAATGTPIMATGDGKVEFVGTKGGYGRTVILSHGGKYTTLYAHMSRYKKGIKSGKRVSQGDVIGYVGMSGTATGPHLHYEFRVDGVHRNPLTVALPKAEPLPNKFKNDFLKKAQPLLAQLDGIPQNTRLALNND
jgi:murein DD-endopeptidase MepM/ murein hydrolase activator NlpD